MASIVGIPESRRKKWASQKIEVLTHEGKLVDPQELQRQMNLLREQLERLAAAAIPEYEDHDVVFLAALGGSTQPVLHGLGVTPTGYNIMFTDIPNNAIWALPSSGWGPKVVYFLTGNDGFARIRLFKS